MPSWAINSKKISNYKYFNKMSKTSKTNKPAQLGIGGVISRFLLWYKQLTCKHEKWDCDTQIRTIQCRECGKRAWIENYRSLY